MKMTFGQYEGEDLATVPMSYLWWLWEQGNLKDGPMKEAIRQRIEPERFQPDPLPDRTPTTVQLVNLARQVLGKFTAPSQAQN